MTASVGPNWMIVTGLLYSTFGAFVLGKIMIALGAMNAAGMARKASHSQQQLDVLTGLSLIAAGAMLQIFGQIGGGAPSGVIVVLLLVLIAALMVYALCDGIMREPVRKLPAVKKDILQRAVPMPMPVPVLIATSVPVDPKIAVKA